MYPLTMHELQKTTKMKTTTTLLLYLVFVLLFSISWAHTDEDFLQCYSLHSPNTTSISKLIYTSKQLFIFIYLAILNTKFEIHRPKPLVIITPLHKLQIQATTYCSKNHGMQIRVRSGGHDYDGLSYVSEVPFVIVDLKNLRSITINAESNTAWVESGTLTGELYYRIAEKMFALLLVLVDTLVEEGIARCCEKYDLAADNVIDARIIDVNGNILDRKSRVKTFFGLMEEVEGASFGVILPRKVKLVIVLYPVTIFTLDRTLEQNATNLVHKWQYIAHKFPQELFIRVLVRRVNSSQDGKKKNNPGYIHSNLARPIDARKLPELGLTKQDCIEMSWIKSILYFHGFTNGEPLEVLLNRTQTSVFVVIPILIPSLVVFRARVGMLSMSGVKSSYTAYGGRAAQSAHRSKNEKCIRSFLSARAAVYALE
ncbi:hypothetical protein HYC85_018108 [Camellia sinensis]|uniref:FAD-binding PCMH-type domain-containing protein n=1 Tax=Camellia sinensis TaxID=4442 RepID=A0A7J7GVS3_CAMSI|nr:hypothetical protein HYC85_018108 [Camellia sinensis]